MSVYVKFIVYTQNFTKWNSNISKLIEACFKKLDKSLTFLGAWLSEETMAMREEVYEILPFILTLSNETFESQKLAKLSNLPGRGSTDFSDFTEASSTTMLQKQGKQVQGYKYLNMLSKQYRV